MKEIIRWLLELEDNSTIVAIANANKTNVPGFRIQKAPRKKVIDALIHRNVPLLVKTLLEIGYRNDGKNYEDLSIKELKERAKNRSSEMPLIFLSLLDNHHIDIANQLFNDLREEGILNGYQKEKHETKKDVRPKLKPESKEVNKKLYEDALKKIKALETKLNKAQENEEKLKIQIETEREKNEFKKEALDQKLQDEARRSNEAIRNYKQEQKNRESLEKENDNLKDKIAKLEKEKQDALKIIKDLEEKNAEQNKDVDAVTTNSGIIVGNASLHKIAQSSPYDLVLENELTDDILNESAQIILPLFASNVVTRRRVSRCAADRVLEFKTFIGLKNYLEGVEI
jgi:flagellar biosynthesis GTPase FlhF